MKFINYYKIKREPNHNAAVVHSDMQGHRSTNIGEILNLGQHRGNPGLDPGARRD
ncbi:MAG: hypothetical protein JWM20_811 [Patescibacteria group bacterium]|nr:hypothetical protein [Patescibacteria group bacterium]